MASGFIAGNAHKGGTGWGWAILTIPRYIAMPNIHDTGIAEITILTVLLRNAMLLIKELFEVKADPIVAQYGTSTFDV